VTRSRFSNPLVLAAVILPIGGIFALLVWRSVGGVPSLNEVRALARVRRFDQAQVLLRRYLKVHPDNPRARLLMAELSTEPKNPNPQEALRQLRAVHP
jgi:hypothetical protein